MFSLAYYGVCRVTGVSYTWIEALVTSVFIPFFVGDLPKTVSIRILAGIHCSLFVGISIGTIFSFLHRRLEAIRKAAEDLSDRFSEQAALEKYTPASKSLADCKRDAGERRGVIIGAGGPPNAKVLHVRFFHDLFGYRDNRQLYARRVGGIVKHPDICFSHLRAVHLRFSVLEIA